VRTEYLVGGVAVVSAGASFPATLDGYAASSSLAGKVFAKVSVPDYGSLLMSYNVSQALFAGLAGTGVAALAPPLDLSGPRFAPAEIHYSFDIGKLVFLRIGKQLVAWGPSVVWTPVDFLNVEKADSFSAFDQRQGRPGLRLHVPVGTVNVFAFADFSGLVAHGAVLDPADVVDVAGRIDLVLGGFELGLTGFGSAHKQNRIGLDFSGDLLSFATYGEVGWAPAYDSYNYRLLASLGFSRALGDLRRWTVSAEAFYNSDGADFTGDLAAMAGHAPLYMGRWYAYAALEGRELFSPDLTTKLSCLANFSDGSFRLQLGESLSFPRSVPLTASLAWVGGGKDKEFTALVGDASLSLSISTRLEF
jgi:hypothetical protein